MARCCCGLRIADRTQTDQIGPTLLAKGSLAGAAVQVTPHERDLPIARLYN